MALTNDALPRVLDIPVCSYVGRMVAFLTQRLGRGQQNIIHVFGLDVRGAGIVTLLTLHVF